MKNLENSVNCLDHSTDHTESYPAMILISLSSMYTSLKTTRFKFTNQESGLAHQNSLQDIIGMGRPKRDPDTHPSGLTSCCRKKNYLTSVTLKRAPHTTILWILNPVVKRSRKTSHLQVISHSLETCFQSQSRVVLMLPQEHSLPTMV